ncbi:MAG: flagellar biosynthetic protein FliR [Lachnospiraceae bacterium]|nr:flagellar biosynthetic protein FliR [Lachnospiraceae bacterium]
MSFTFSLVNFEYFLLILVRLASFFFVAPLFSDRGMPNQSKIGLSCLIAIMVLYNVSPTEVSYFSVLGYSVLVLKEAITGLLIGFSAYICSSILLFAGNLIDVDIGIGMAQEYDPNFNAQVTITGNLYYYFMMIFFIITNMYQFVVRAVIDSFTLIPLGGAEFETDVLITAMATYITNVFVIGFRIFLPVFATILIMNCVLGIMAKVAQQLNMFSVGIQIKILAGLCVLYVMIYLFPEICNYIFEQMSIMMRSVVEGMY